MVVKCGLWVVVPVVEELGRPWREVADWSG